MTGLSTLPAWAQEKAARERERRLAEELGVYGYRDDVLERLATGDLDHVQANALLRAQLVNASIR